jgi:hypothetical protein
VSLRLEDIELIKQLKYRYQRAIDACDVPTLDTLFIEQANAQYTGGDYEVICHGKSEILEFIRRSFTADSVASHVVSEPIVTVADCGEKAEGQFTLQDYFLTISTNQALVGVAIYRDNFVKKSAEWKIERISYTRLYERRFQEAPHYLAANLLSKTGNRP